MYRTANNLEDLVIEMELNSYDSVGHAVGRGSFWGIDKQYHDVDFYIMMLDNSEEEEIKKLLQSCGWTAWLEYDLEEGETMVKIS
jgi:hypothetical protein